MVYIRGLTEQDVATALHNTNRFFDNNILFKRFDSDKNKIIVTLKVSDIRKKGSRISPSGRHINAACWHVYGAFFDECFKINPNCKITQCGQPLTYENNWTDFNIGSQMYPFMYSDSCACKDNGIHYEVKCDVRH